MKKTIKGGIKMKKTLAWVLVLCAMTMLFGCAQQVATSTTETATTEVSTSVGEASTTGTAVDGWDGTFDGTIKVGAVGPLTGAAAESGIAAKQGQELAVAEWNAKGGIVIEDQHYEIDLLYEDSAGTAETAVAAAEKLLGMDKVDVIFADTLISSCILAVMDLCSKYPDVLFSTIEGVSTAIPQKFATDPDQYYNFYKACWSSDSYGKIVADSAMYLVDQGIIEVANKTVAYVIEDTDYGRNNMIAAEEVFTGYGYTTVAMEVSTSGTTDFYSQINKLMQLDPDIVVSCFVPVASGIAYVKQVQELGAEWTDIAIVYPTKPGFYEDSGSACADLFWTPVEVDYNSEPLLDFAARIDAMFGVSITKCQCSGYDVTNMMFEAIEKAGTWKASEGLAEVYGASEYSGLCGTFVFDENHCAIAGKGYLNLMLAQVQPDATNSLIVYPEEYAQTEPYAQF